MKSYALVTVHHRIVTSKLLTLVPYAEKQVPGSVIFRGCCHGIDIPVGDFVSESCAIVNNGTQRTLVMKNVCRGYVTMRINDDSGIVPFQVEVWSMEEEQWRPWMLREPIQMYVLRTPHSEGPKKHL